MSRMRSGQKRTDSSSMPERLDCNSGEERNNGEHSQHDPDMNFSASEVKKLTEHILTEKLKDIKYDPRTCKTLSQELAGLIMERIKGLNFKRYKMVAVVTLGSIKDGNGLQFGSRCLWTEKSDCFTSVKYTNGSIFAVVMIYGLYYE